eukprot:2558194-Pleurochrysis_carterae.AAC.10
MMCICICYCKLARSHAWARARLSDNSRNSKQANAIMDEYRACAHQRRHSRIERAGTWHALCAASTCA